MRSRDVATSGPTNVATRRGPSVRTAGPPKSNRKWPPRARRRAQIAQIRPNRLAGRRLEGPQVVATFRRPISAKLAPFARADLGGR